MTLSAGTRFGPFLVEAPLGEGGPPVLAQLMMGEFRRDLAVAQLRRMHW